MKKLLIFCILFASATLSFSQYSRGNPSQRQQNFYEDCWFDDTVFIDNGILKMTSLVSNAAVDSILVIDNNIARVYTGGFATSAQATKFGVSGSDANSIYTLNSGNVGIGVDPPTAKLHVNGSAIITSGLSIGTDAVSSNFSVGGVLETQSTSNGNIGTGEDVLMTYTLANGALGTAEDRVELTGFGTLAANGQNKRIRIYFGSTVIFDTGTVTHNALDWSFSGVVIRTGAATQIASCNFIWENTGADTDFTSPLETLSGSVVIKVTGEASSDNDIVQKAFLIDYKPTN